MAEILFINPNIVFPVNAVISGRALPVRNIEKVVNLGLLSIASHLDTKGVSLKIIDLVGCEDDEEKIRQVIKEEQPKFIGISCISCYAYPKLEEYAGLIKDIDDNIFVMAGGQHVLGIPNAAMQDIPSLDCVIRGEGEFVTYDIIKRVNEGGSLSGISSIIYRENGKVFDNTETFAQVPDLDDLAFLRYDLYPDFQEYVPHVEESRNCSFSCNFCTAAFVEGGIRHKSVPRFIEEVNYIKSLYGDRKEKLKFFFACSNFGLKKKRIEELIQLFKEKEVNVAWRTQTRVDTPVVHYLDQLADVGLSVLDLGLESASINTLKLMNKTKNGERYIDKARDFIKKAGAVEGLLLKVNLVWFAGETPDTSRVRTRFMLDHTEYSEGLSVGPVMV